jgi:lipopolysaccharide biosynthesis protein
MIRKEKKHSIRTIAFYLPQFHQIPENDEWWGDGFTEWTNVKKAKPLFEGHHQPILPHSDIGFYDLSNPDVQKKQIEMAKKYNIDGFCYYYYWFNGKKLLSKPLENLRNNPNLDLPFCVCWANENWTRRWDGKDKEILISQNHSDEDDLNFIRELIPLLKDERYIKVNNKPLLLIYRPALLPNSKKTMNIWREEARKNGIEDLHIVRVENFNKGIPPADFGLNASIKFAPNFDICSEKKMLEKPIVFSYDELIKEDFSDIDFPYFKYKCVCPNWDNASRRQDGGGVTFVDSDPSKFEYWLYETLKYTIYNFSGDERLVFVNAWNEWGEGCHLEPDEKYGYKWLDSVKKSIDRIENEFEEYILFEQEVKISIMNKIKILRDNLEKKDKKIEDKNKEIEDKNKEIEDKNKEIEDKNKEIVLIKSSKFWSIRARYIKIKKILSICNKK